MKRERRELYELHELDALRAGHLPGGCCDGILNVA